ncbi:TolC family protein [Planctomicrobium piriforme]|uniref:Efflux transporter, outer membrane factor (OMF) lipoprotein, NodT family n=1 Tax=Planctomicrobium piriforme TaxID=1576369 RepID=A0A1I3B0F9_9PLAN|nr:TolC family protein [Planctomicrobium piriforme]SFH55764.1 efflux transporter, outer membrane factor (OMF) lipoprotein, NodT family [Planctomicrobium piriforme]
MVLFPRSSKTLLKNRPIATAIACGVLLVLESCGIPKLRGPEPARELPVNFKGETEVSMETSAQLGIEEFFNDQKLTFLIYHGLSGNQELKILGEQIQIANNEVLRRRGSYLPFVGFGARSGLEKPSLYTPLGAVDDQLFTPRGNNFPTPLPNFMIAADVSWQVDIWRQLRNSRDAAVLRYLATTDGRNYVVTRLVAEIAENYYTLMALDKRLENLDRTIVLQERSLEIAKANKEGARGTELPVQRFQAEVRKNQSEKLIINQEILEVENRINFLAGRFPQPVSRVSDQFFELQLHALSLGLPSQLLQNRPDIRQAEHELAAAGLDVKVARAEFYPKLNIYAGVGYEAFNAKYIFMTPDSLIYNVVGDLTAPVLNKAAIKAEFKNANAEQLQRLYEYQRTILEAFTEVFNRVSKVENYSKSIEIKKQQLQALEDSVDAATKLFNATRIEYLDVLYAQRDLMDARMVLIETKKEQLGAIVNTYQALGGGLAPPEFLDWNLVPPEPVLPTPGYPTDAVMICPTTDMMITPPHAVEQAVPTPAPPAAVPPATDGPALVPPSPANGGDVKPATDTPAPVQQ